MKFTLEDSKELGMPIKLLDQWQDIMNALWATASSIDPNNVKNDGENSIVWQTHMNVQWKISVKFINKSWLRIELEKNSTEILTLRYDGDNLKPYSFARFVLALITI